MAARGVVDRRDRTLKAHAEQLLHSLCLQFHEAARLARVQVAWSAQGDADDAQQLVFIDGRDSLAQQKCFDL